jgi:PAS domain S-box-containing protein
MRQEQNDPWMTRVDVCLRLMVPVLLVIAVTAGALAVTRTESLRDGVLVLAGGLAFAAVIGALAATTERRRLAMREVERYFTLSPEMVILAGFDGYWKRVNPTVGAVLGYTEREALARPFMEFVHPDDRERTEEEARRVVGGAKALAFENRILCKDGSYKLIEWTVTPVPEERVMYGIGRDVTDQRRSENEQAALRRVATLVARDAPSTEVFEAVATEVAKLLDTDITVLGRYDDDGAATAIGSWSASPVGVPVGTRSVVGGHNVLTLVAETGKPARVEGYDHASGEAAEIARRFGWSSSIAAPVIVEGRLWGVMLVATQRAEPFPAGAEERLAAFTDLVATAVANAQAHDEVRRFGDEQAALGRVATLVAGGAAPEHVFTAVVKEASSLLGLERIELVRYEGDATGTVIAASGDHPFPAGTTWSLDDPSVMATVARTKSAARIDDYGDLEGQIARTARSAGFRSAIGTPITVEGRLWGVIIAISTDPEPIPERSVARLGQFTELVATAVANADARQALERVAAEQAALRRIATLVARGVEPEATFAAVTGEIADMFGAIAAIMRFEDDPPAVVFLGVSEETEVPIGTRWEFADEMTSAEVYRTGRSARLGIVDWAAHTGPMAEAGRRLNVHSQVSSPIIVEGSLWGDRCERSRGAAGRHGAATGEVRRARHDRNRKRREQVRARCFAPTNRRRVGRDSPADRARPARRHAAAACLARIGGSCGGGGPTSRARRPARAIVRRRYRARRCDRRSTGDLPRDPSGDSVQGRSRPGVAGARAPFRDSCRSRHSDGHASRGADRSGGLLRRV